MKTILLIEDNEDLRKNIAEILELSNYKVLTAANGKDGIIEALKHKPDIIICDIMMPVLDGYGVLHTLQKNPETQYIPFIFLTAKTEREDIRQGMNMGADDYITKPFNEIELLDAIEQRLIKIEILKTKFSSGITGLQNLISTVSEQKTLKNLVSEYVAGKYKRNAIIYSENNHPVNLFYIEKGTVKTYKENEDGKQFTTGLYTNGEFFGYTALLEGTNYKESAETIEDTEITFIPRKEFEELLRNSSEVLRKFMHLLAGDVAGKGQQLLDIAYNSVRKKVANALITLYKMHKDFKSDPLIIDIGRSDLASMAGTARETLIRTLSEFKEEKVIDITDRHIKILHLQKLINMVN